MLAARGARRYARAVGTSRPWLALALGAVLAHAGAAAADPRANTALVPQPAERAEPAAAAAPIAAQPESAERRHAVFVEAFGRGGVWGLGYGLQLGRRFGVGAVVSASPHDGQRLLSFAPYVTAYPLGGWRHRMFVDAGPQLVHLSTPSPVPEWDGTSSTGVGGHLAAGYELRTRVLVRAFAMVVIGDDGAAPWFGFDLGWTL